MRQLTGVDASFLSFETRTAVGHVTGVIVVDPSSSPAPWTFERLRAHLLSRIDRLEPFRQKLVEVPLGLDRPYWTRDPDFDIDAHLHHLAVPGDGSREAFADLVARTHERPLDRRRPLWECSLVEGLADGRMAVITKIHHAAIDGLSGQELLAALVDLDPGPVDIPEPEPEPEHEPEPTLSQEEMLSRAARSLVGSPSRMFKAGRTLAQAAPVIGIGFSRRSPVARGDESMMELVRRFGAAPRTPFNASIGPRRSWAYTTLDLDLIKAIKNEAGTTVNDVILAIVAGVLRQWLVDNDALPDRPLAAMIPLSVRGAESEHAIGNYISSTITTLATHIDDPAERLTAVKAGMDTAKADHDTLPADILTDLTQVAPPAVAALAARLVASTKLADRVTLPFNVVISNVPGPPIPLYLAGALITGHFPVSAIVDGVGLNVTVVSIDGGLHFGFVADRDLLPNLWEMADLLDAATQELATAVGLES
ncbi:MAG: wax ester/triacylglycerol synthase family O-acyltransferase [Actinomycetota bacterium]